jgi:serine carboxypeptidase-like clade 1
MHRGRLTSDVDHSLCVCTGVCVVLRDACVPYTDNQAWTASLGYPVVDPWHPWMYTLDFEGTVSQQVGGYSTVYKSPAGHNFTFITVRGGRHEVPETAPDKALAMLQRLVTGGEF